MTPGIPGSGIGGLFYVCCALVLTVRDGWRRVRGQPRIGESRDVAQLALLAVGIGLGIWIAGWLVGLIIAPDLAHTSRPGARALFGNNVQVQNALRVAALVVGAGTLALVMLGVELTRFWQRIKSNRLTIDAR
jgi:hypothetical protein